jgi:hypothetical protein
MNAAEAKAILRATADDEDTVALPPDVLAELTAADLPDRASGWGSRDLGSLVLDVERASTPDERGRSLEELVSRLFETVPGFTVTGRIRTATEEY